MFKAAYDPWYIICAGGLFFCSREYQRLVSLQGRKRVMNTQQFLDHLHGPGSAIYFNVAGRTWKNRPRVFDSPTDTLLKYRNSEGDDICFIVNSGGTCDHQITRINAVFVDWDCGKDQDGKYFDEDAATAKKAEFQKLLGPFRPIPSAVVETRNGFHVYWFLESGVACDQFREAQKRLAHKFNGDPRVSNPARVMRLPGFDWVKPQSGLPRFLVKVISGNGDRYTLQAVLATVEVVPDRFCSGSCLSSTQNPSPNSTVVDGRICAHNSTGVLNTPDIVGSYPATPIAEDITSLKKNIDLAQWLTDQVKRTVTTGTTVCPFHNDTNPSAGVFRGKDRTWLFRCHSCGITGSIIDMAMKVWGCDARTAIRYLVGTGGAPVDPLKCQVLLDLLDRNIEIITGLEKQTYPGLWRLLHRVRSDLISKLKVASEAVKTSGLEIHGQPLFFSSLRWLSGASRGLDGLADWPSRQNEKVDRYCLLGLLRKLPDTDIPDRLLQKARQHQGDRQYRIQFYCVPDYTATVLIEAEKRAQSLLSTGSSVRGISYQLLESVFGKARADEVYPQQGVGNSERARSFAAKVELAIQAAITDKGYATMADIRKSLEAEGNGSVRSRRIEKCLPSVLANNKLVRRICNGEMKKRLKIPGTGYPKVIVPV